MIYRDFGKTSWQVGAVGLGTWNIGKQWGAVDEATAWATVRAAFDSGVNLFDTAESYGMPNGLSEERLGRGLAGIRHQVYLVSKIGNWGKRTGGGVPKDTVDLIRLCAHASLHRLGTEWHDVLLCHEGGIEDPAVYLEAFEALVAEGRLRYYGVSTNDLDVLKNFNRHGTCAVVQVDYSLLNRQPEEAFLPYCQEQGIAVMVRGPLAKGLLSGGYGLEAVFADEVRGAFNEGGEKRTAYEGQIAQVEKLARVVAPGAEMVRKALQYAFSHPVQPVVIPGAKSPEQARANAAAGDAELLEVECEKLRI
jgi:aryl-alcohol dehydrogenase-like predicted oxidoreductase